MKKGNKKKRERTESEEEGYSERERTGRTVRGIKGTKKTDKRAGRVERERDREKRIREKKKLMIYKSTTGVIARAESGIRLTLSYLDSDHNTRGGYWQEPHDTIRITIPWARYDTDHDITFLRYK